VARLCGSERIDGLCIVANHGDAWVALAEGSEHINLQTVDILVLVNEDMVQGASEARSKVIVENS
jgi:hypothetical protein